jgi:hypothetical protein
MLFLWVAYIPAPECLGPQIRRVRMSGCGTGSLLRQRGLLSLLRSMVFLEPSVVMRSMDGSSDALLMRLDICSL